MEEASISTLKAGATVRPTRERLLRAAEKLFSEHGIAGTSTRAILRASGQRNESALQYHFGGRDGLIEELYAERGAQVGTERHEMLREIDTESDVDLRHLCEMAVLPPVRLARRDPGFVRFLRVIGQLAFLPSQRLQEVTSRYESDSVVALSRLLRPRLRLPDELYERRFELVHRMAVLALAQRALADEAFDGPDADLFFANLLDAMTAVLEAPPSGETQRCTSSSSWPTPRRTSPSTGPTDSWRTKSRSPESRSPES